MLIALQKYVYPDQLNLQNPPHLKNIRPRCNKIHNRLGRIKNHRKRENRRTQVKMLEGVETMKKREWGKGVQYVLAGNYIYSISR